MEKQSKQKQSLLKPSCTTRQMVGEGRPVIYSVLLMATVWITAALVLFLSEGASPANSLLWSLAATVGYKSSAITTVVGAMTIALVQAGTIVTSAGILIFSVGILVEKKLQPVDRA